MECRVKSSEGPGPEPAFDRYRILRGAQIQQRMASALRRRRLCQGTTPISQDIAGLSKNAPQNGPIPIWHVATPVKNRHNKHETPTPLPAPDLCVAVGHALP